MPEKDPFQRERYRALIYGTTVISGEIHHFDVLSGDDSARLLKGRVVVRISGRLVISEAVEDRRSMLSQMDSDLFSTNGQGSSLDEAEKSEPLQPEVLQEFVRDEQRRLAEYGQTYEGPCI